MNKKKRCRFGEVSLDGTGRNARPLFIWVKVLVLADAAGNATRYGYDAAVDLAPVRYSDGTGNRTASSLGGEGAAHTAFLLRKKQAIKASPILVSPLK